MSVYVVIAVVLTVAAIGGLILFLKRRHRRMLDAMSPEERELHEAEKEYKGNVRRANAELAKAKLSHTIKVANAERALKKANGQGRERVGSYIGKNGSSIELFQNRIVLSRQEHTFESGPVEATVDTAGNLAVTKRASAAKYLVLGSDWASLFKKTEKHDSRELYLLVEGTDFAGLVECRPDDGPKVRQLAVAIKNTSRSYPSVQEARENAVSQAQRALEAVQKDNAVEAATSGLEDAKSNTQRLDAARSNGVSEDTSTL